MELGGKGVEALRIAQFSVPIRTLVNEDIAPEKVRVLFHIFRGKGSVIVAFPNWELLRALVEGELVPFIGYLLQQL